ncbi:MAG: DUF72 domain-containing protein [Gammaproteobacteria bacterium]|jgi:uncharacterized protein YecE (DUF72 family)|nr:DUF72 domain-containing protein [Gammaproteobacteria bacterium]
MTIHASAESTIRVGTSGWHYPHWQGPYYPADLAPDGWLTHYARDFRTVEVNGTFYGLPEPATFNAWREATPEGFTFALKVPRAVTHLHKLRNCEQPLGEFLARARLLGPKLGPILFQLPPRWHANPRRLAELLAGLPAGLRFAFELRDPSWHNEEVYGVLRSRNAAFCVYDLAGFTAPLVTTADFAYVRLHGPGDLPYAGSYSEPQLRDWAAKARQWAGRGGKDVYLYFDNDQSGYAVRNATGIQKYLDEDIRGNPGAAVVGVE